VQGFGFLVGAIKLPQGIDGCQASQQQDDSVKNTHFLLLSEIIFIVVELWQGSALLSVISITLAISG
jgi:hypothetical protein